MNEALNEALALLKASGLASSEPIPPIPSQVGIGVTGQEGVNQGFSGQANPDSPIAAPPIPTFAGSSGQPPFEVVGSGRPPAEGDGATFTAWQPMSGSQMVMRAIGLLENVEDDDPGTGGGDPSPSEPIRIFLGRKIPQLGSSLVVYSPTTNFYTEEVSGWVFRDGWDHAGISMDSTSIIDISGVLG